VNEILCSVMSILVQSDMPDNIGRYFTGQMEEEQAET